MLLSPSIPSWMSQPFPPQLHSQWGIFLLEPMEISVSPPREQGWVRGAPQTPGSVEEGEASSWRKPQIHLPAQLWTSIFALISLGWG